MGPSSRTNPSLVTLNGRTFSYTVGDAALNSAWSFHGMLTHYRDLPGSVSTGHTVRLTVRVRVSQR